jgi:hypothetical protein
VYSVAKCTIVHTAQCTSGILVLIRSLVNSNREQKIDVSVTLQSDDPSKQTCIMNMSVEQGAPIDCLEAAVGDVELDPLQYPHVAVEALQDELERTRSQWRVDVQELESLFIACQPEKSEAAWSEEVEHVKESLESMTRLYEAAIQEYEAAIQERDEAKNQSSRDIHELEEMVAVLHDQNQKLTNKLDSMPVHHFQERAADRDAIKHSDSSASQNSSINEPVEEPDVMSPSPSRSQLPTQPAPEQSPKTDKEPVLYFNIDTEPGITNGKVTQVQPPSCTSSTPSLFANM